MLPFVVVVEPEKEHPLSPPTPAGRAKNALNINTAGLRRQMPPPMPHTSTQGCGGVCATLHLRQRWGRAELG